MATFKEWTKTFAYLLTLYPSQAAKMSAATGKAYYSVLQDLTDDAIRAAATKLGAESKWFPAAAEIRQAAFELMQGDGLPLAIEGWHQLQKSFQGGSVEYDPLTLKTINTLGGRRKLGMTTDNDLPFLRAQFIKTFETFRNREIEDRRQLPSVREYKQLQAQNIDGAFKQLAEKLSANRSDDGHTN